MKSRPIIFLLILVAVLFLIFIGLRSKKSSCSQRESNFALPTKIAPDKISIESKNAKLVVQKTSSGWTVNNTLRAKPQMVVAAVKVLQSGAMDYPLSNKEQQSLIDSIEEKGTTITVFEKNKQVYKLQFFDKERKTFVRNTRGNIFKLTIKGYEKLCLGDIFSVESSRWAENLLIDIDAGELKQLKLAYPDEPEKGFSIQVLLEGTTLEDYKGNNLTNCSPENLNDYLHFFKGIGYEKSSPAILLEKPFFILDISTRNDKKMHLETYRVLSKHNGRKDINIFAGIVNKSDTIILKYSDFDPILVDPLWFRKN